MAALLALLAVTNLITLGVLGWLLLRPSGHGTPEPDAVVRSALDGAPAPTGALGVRRIITIEILNPIQLAGTRGRMAGIAGSLVPSITKRVVYDQALKQVRRDLTAQHAIADVRLHTIRPTTTATVGAQHAAAGPRTRAMHEPLEAEQPAAADVPVYFDEIRRLDLDEEY
ncbi:MAG: hypothetical protein ACTHMS_19340 [Jatrophihabitans sp.]|uniref:hypothetical protein n=1 Tax=Jatrophihabitans sp. TaxID=1932789 RepID=UPI003F8022FF